MRVSLVFDAWAILAWLKDQEPAAGRVQELLESSRRGEVELAMSIVNLGEVFYLAVKARDFAYGERVLQAVKPRLQIIQATNQRVMSAAALKARYSISYADAFAATTAIERGCALVTGDPELRIIAREEDGFQLEWIGS